jgi:predicted regulator of Ras-like GTPase activity (Roadblock/LC7/MglB family)
MKDGLREINELLGIWGSLVCNNQGDIIQGNTPPGLSNPSLGNISRNAISMFAAASEPMQGISELVIHYSERKLFVQDIGKAFLVVISTPSVDISLLRMTINVVLSRWDGDAKVQKELNHKFAERI